MPLLHMVPTGYLEAPSHGYLQQTLAWNKGH